MMETDNNNRGQREINKDYKKIKNELTTENKKVILELFEYYFTGSIQNTTFGDFTLNAKMVGLADLLVEFLVNIIVNKDMVDKLEKIDQNSKDFLKGLMEYRKNILESYELYAFPRRFRIINTKVVSSSYGDILFQSTLYTNSQESLFFETDAAGLVGLIKHHLKQLLKLDPIDREKLKDKINDLKKLLDGDNNG